MLSWRFLTCIHTENIYIRVTWYSPFNKKISLVRVQNYTALLSPWFATCRWFFWKTVRQVINTMASSYHVPFPNTQNSSVETMDEGTLKTSIPKCYLYWSFLFGVVWCSNFVGSESGQKQSVKLLQNMIYNTTQHPPSPPQPQTVCKYCTFTLGRGGGGRSETR